jgi:hypothetical protein
VHDLMELISAEPAGCNAIRCDIDYLCRAICE